MVSNEHISRQVMMRLRQIVRELSRHSKNLQDQYHITVPQLICLHEIFHDGPITIGALTKNVFLNNSTITGIVDRLERRRLVERIRMSQDRRQIHVQITEAGAAFLEQAPEPLQASFVSRISALEETEKAMILKSLDLLLEMIGTSEVLPVVEEIAAPLI